MTVCENCLTCKVRSTKSKKVKDYILKVMKSETMECGNRIIGATKCVTSSRNLFIIIRAYNSEGCLIPITSEEEENNGNISILPYLVEIGEGLEQLHNHNIINGNLKPSNILLTDDKNHILLCDYGINEIRNYSVENINYFSPEELKSNELSNNSDIWSYGCIIYYYLTNGDILFKGKNLNDIYLMINECNYNLDKSFPCYYRALLIGMLNVDPLRRISLDIVISLLNNIKEDKSNNITDLNFTRDTLKSIGMSIDEKKLFSSGNEMTIGIDLGGKYLKMSGYESSNQNSIPMIIENVYNEKKSEMIVDYTNSRLFGKINNENSNYKNVITEIKDLFGKKYSDVENIEKNHFPESICRLNDDSIGFKFTRSNGNEVELNICDIFYGYIHNIHNYISTKYSTSNINCVFSAPANYTNSDIEVIKQIFTYNGFNTIYVIPEYISTGLYYGYKMNSKYLRDTVGKLVLIIDIGYLNTTISLNKYRRNSFEIVNNVFLNNLGGREVDNIMMEYFDKLIKDSCNVSIYEIPRYYLKVKNEIIKLKESLSNQITNSLKVHINLDENIFDYSFTYNEFITLLTSKFITERLIKSLNEIINNSKLSDDEKKSLEVVLLGGSSRIPLFESAIEECLKSMKNENKINKSLYIDECISNGNSYYGLIKEGKWKYAIVNEPTYNSVQTFKKSFSLPSKPNPMFLKILNSYYLIKSLNNNSNLSFDFTNSDLIELSKCLKHQISYIKKCLELNNVENDSVNDDKKLIEELFKVINENWLKYEENEGLLELCTISYNLQEIISNINSIKEEEEEESEENEENEKIKDILSLIEMQFDFFHSHIDIVKTKPLLEHSKEMEEKLSEYDKNAELYSLQLAELQTQIYENQSVIETFKDCQYEYINELLRYLQILPTQLHFLSKLEDIEYVIQALNTKLNSVVELLGKDMKKMKNNIAYDYQCEYISQPQKDTLKLLFNIFPNPLPTTIYELADIYSQVQPQYSQLIHDGKLLLSQKVSDYMDMFDKRREMSIKMNELDKIIEKVADNIEVKYNSLKSIYEILNEIDEKANLTNNEYHEQLTKYINEIQECVPKLENEKELKMEFIKFQTTHPTYQRQNLNVSDEINRNLSIYEDFNRLLNMTKKRLALLIEDFNTNVGSLNLNIPCLVEYKRIVENVKSNVDDDHHSLISYCEDLNKLTSYSQNSIQTITALVNNLIDSIKEELSNEDNNSDKFSSLNDYLNEAQMRLMMIHSFGENCKLYNEIIERREDTIATKKSELITYLSECSEEVQLLPKIIKDDFNQFSNSILGMLENAALGLSQLILIENDVLKRSDQIVKSYLTSFETYKTKLLNLCIRLDDIELKDEIDEFLSKNHKVTSISEAFSLNKSACDFYKRILVDKCNKKKTKLNEFLGLIKENKEELNVILENVPLEEAQSYVDDDFTKYKFDVLETKLEDSKKIIMKLRDSVTENMNKFISPIVEQLIEYKEKYPVLEKLIEKYQSILSNKRSDKRIASTDLIKSYLEVKDTYNDIQNELKTEIEEEKNIIQLFIFYFNTTPEVFSFLENDNIKKYKELFDKYSNKDDRKASLEVILSIVDLKELHQRFCDSIHDFIKDYYDKVSKILKSITFVDENDNSKHIKPYKENEISKLISTFTKYRQSIIDYYKSVTIDTISHLNEVNYFNIVECFSDYYLSQLDEYSQRNSNDEGSNEDEDWKTYSKEILKIYHSSILRVKQEFEMHLSKIENDELQNDLKKKIEENTITFSILFDVCDTLFSYEKVSTPMLPTSEKGNKKKKLIRRNIKSTNLTKNKLIMSENPVHSLSQTSRSSSKLITSYRRSVSSHLQRKGTFPIKSSVELFDGIEPPPTPPTSNRLPPPHQRSGSKVKMTFKTENKDNEDENLPES